MHDVGFDSLGLKLFDPPEPSNPFDSGDLHCREDGAISFSELWVQGDEIMEGLLSCPISRPGQGSEAMP